QNELRQTRHVPLCQHRRQHPPRRQASPLRSVGECNVTLSRTTRSRQALTDGTAVGGGSILAGTGLAATTIAQNSIAGRAPIVDVGSTVLDGPGASSENLRVDELVNQR